MSNNLIQHLINRISANTKGTITHKGVAQTLEDLRTLTQIVLLVAEEAEKNTKENDQTLVNVFLHKSLFTTKEPL